LLGVKVKHIIMVFGGHPNVLATGRKLHGMDVILDIEFLYQDTFGVVD